MVNYRLCFSSFTWTNVLYEDDAWTFAYADDVALITKTATKLQKVLNKWNSELHEAGMRINIEKTKVMMVSRQRNDLQVRLGDAVLEFMENFDYLGVTLNEKCCLEEEINHRISKYFRNGGLMYPLLKERNIPMKVKTTIYTTILRPLLTYGCECWVLMTKLRSQLQAAEMRVLRLIVGVTRLDRLRNDNIRRELGVESIIEFTERNQIRWCGHLLQMPENRRPLIYY